MGRVAIDRELVRVGEDTVEERARPEVRDVDDADRSRVRRDERERVVAAAASREREGERGRAARAERETRRVASWSEVLSPEPEAREGETPGAERAGREEGLEGEGLLHPRRSLVPPITRATTAVPSSAVLGKTQ